MIPDTGIQILKTQETDRRILGNVVVDDPSGLQLQDEKDIKRNKAERGNGTKVAGEHQRAPKNVRELAHPKMRVSWRTQLPI
jgi:hypothetical protein